MIPAVPPVLPVAVVRPYDPPATAYGAGHRGIDLAAETGHEVRAMAAGRIRFVGSVAGIEVVTVEHAGGIRSTYEPVHGQLAEGSPVFAGQVIGIVAAAGGHCGGANGCLHVGVRDARGYLDPTPWLAGIVLKTLRQPPADEPDGRSLEVSPQTHAYSAASSQGTRAPRAPVRL